MDTRANSFYITGGTLPLESGSYVTRQADTDLLEGLQRGEFCYVLNTRQMGKSSLMVRTAHHLRSAGCRVIILDLTAIGQNLTIEQWYSGLVGRIAQQTDREDELLAFWEAQTTLGPMQRFVEALRRVLLTRKPSGEAARTGQAADGDADNGRLVLFIDEIDAVRSLPFSADEFFAGIRECCNRKASEPAFNALAFCLLGVATPSDLIRDTRVTPFNVGQRIELHDFTRLEAMPLAAGLKIHRSDLEAELLLERVLYWTGGHPYMTQRLCRAVAESLTSQGGGGRRDNIEDAALVDNLCQKLFLTRSAQQTDDNLAFARARLLHSEEDRAALLDLYSQVRKGRRVRDEETNPLCPVLRLSGVVKASGGWLTLRNEIYSRVFDAAWIAEHMPHAEVRRQKRAYRLGVLRTASVSGVALAVMAVLAGYAWQQSRNAARSMERAADQELLARSRLSRSYVDAGQRMMEAQNYGGALAPFVEAMRLDQNDPARMEQHRFRFESVLAQSPRLERMWFADSPISAAALSPDRRWMAAGGEDGYVHVWNTDTGRALPLMMRHDARINYVAFHPSGARLATCGNDNKVRIWDLRTLRLRETLDLRCPPDHPSNVSSVAWNRSGRRMVGVGWSRLAVWDFEAKPDGASRLVRDETLAGAGLESAAISDDGQNVAYVAGNYLAHQEQIVGEKAARLGDRGAPQTFCFSAQHIEYSPDGRHLLAAGIFGGTKFQPGAGIYTAIRDFAHKPPTTWERLLPHEDSGVFAAYSPDGTRIVTASSDHTARVWNARDGKPLTPPLPHGGIVNHAAFSGDGSRIVTASADGKVQVWDARTGEKLGSAMRHAGSALFAAFSQDNAHVLTAGQDGTARLWRLPAPGDSPLKQIIPRSVNVDFVDASRLFMWEGVTKQAAGVNHNVSRYALLDTASGSHTVLDDGIAPKDHSSGFNLMRGFSEDGKRSVIWRYELASGAHRRAQVWNLARGVAVGAARDADSAFLSPSGKRALYRQGERTQWVEDVDSGTTLRVVARPNMPTTNALAFTPDEQGLVMADKNGSVWIEDVSSGARRSAPMRHSQEVYRAFYLPDRRTLATVTNKGAVQFWNPESGRAVSAPDQTGNLSTVRFDPIFSPDKKAMLFPRLWRLDTQTPWKPVSSLVFDGPVTFSPDSARFVALRQGLRVFDARTGRMGPRYRGDASTVIHKDGGSSVLQMAFSPDSKRLAAGFEDGTAQIFDARTLSPLSFRMDHIKPVVRILFSPDGNQLVTVSNNGPMRFWDSHTGEALSPPLPFHGSATRLFAWSPEGTQLYLATTQEMRRWTQPNLARPLDEMQAYAYLLSGQRMDDKLGTVSLDTAQLHTAWEAIQSKAANP